MAAEKAAAVHAREVDALILAADTVVAVGRRILPKTAHEGEARRALTLLSGRRHRVHSAVTLIDPKGVARHRLSQSIVTFKRLSYAELASHIPTGECPGNAGGSAIQGPAAALVRARARDHT